MRVIAGEAKGKTLKMVPGEGTRPITDKVKESLFNILQWRVPDSLFLDLFAGTGSVGIEALSRGAQEAVLVEKAIKAVKTIQANLETTGLAAWARVIHTDAFDFVAHTQEPFDIIYVAPPQYKGMWAQMMRRLDQNPPLAPDGLVVVQIFPKEYEDLALRHYTVVDRRQYGSTLLCFYKLRPLAEIPEGKSDDVQTG